MKKINLRILSCMLAVLMLISIVPVMNVSAATTGRSGDYGYSIADGEVTITDFYGTTEADIPAEIEGYPVTIIDYNAFDYNASLESLIIPYTVTTVNAFFEGCYNLNSIVVDEDNPVYDSRNDCNAIIETATNTLVHGCATTIIPEDVTSIGDNAFVDCKSLYEIEIPDRVTSIGEGAFAGCTYLSYIEISCELTSIGQFAFYQCDSITSMELPESLTDIGDFAFAECHSLASITIRRGVSIIPEAAFSDCTALQEITISEGVRSIERYAFDGCSSLSYIELPDGLESIGWGAFSYCSSIREISIPDTVTSIGNEAFMECSSLEHVSIPDGVSVIEPGTFQGCETLYGISLPRSLTYICENAFVGCNWLTEVYYSGTTEEWYWYVCVESEGNITFSWGVDIFCSDGIIGREYTYYDFYLERISYGTHLYDSMRVTYYMGYDSQAVIPSEVEGYPVTHIGYSAFTHNDVIESVTIPQSITAIEDFAFDGCTNLTDVYYEGTPSQWEQIYIGECNEDLLKATIHYPEPEAELNGCTLTLSGELDMNFMFDISEEVLSDETAVIEFTYGGKTVQVPVSEGEMTDYGYKFTCDLPAKDMTTEVSCKVISEGVEGEEFTYSIADYAHAILENPDVYGDAVDIVKSMLNYGAAVQEYFGYNTDNLANDTELMTDEDRQVEIIDFSAYEHTVTEGAGDITYRGASLSLESETAIKLYFNVKSGVDISALEVTVDGKEAELVANGTLYQVKIPNIGANKLDKDFVVRVGDITVEYCVFDYAATAQKNGKDQLVKIMSALYQYAENANKYA